MNVHFQSGDVLNRLLRTQFSLVGLLFAIIMGAFHFQ